MEQPAEIIRNDEETQKRIADLEARVAQLERWARDFALPLLERNLNYAESMELLKKLDKQGVERAIRPDLEARNL